MRKKTGEQRDRRELRGLGGVGASLSTEAIVAAQDSLVLLVCAELDGSVGHHTHHGGRVPTPQTEEAVAEVGEVEQPEGLLERGARSMPPPASFPLHLPFPSQLPEHLAILCPALCLGAPPPAP